MTSMIKLPIAKWSVEDARNLYGTERWGNGYFNINNSGELVVENPSNSVNAEVSLMDIVRGMKERDLAMPALLRIENILDQSISQLNEAFQEVITAEGYRSEYCGVYPVKVNQQAQIVEEVAQFGAQFNHGFEVGSKAEMIAVLSTMDENCGLVVCNGYKDQEFIDLGLQATRLGFDCFFVIETLTELPILIERSRLLNIKPNIGVRVKMTSQVSGYWNSTSGDRSVFGLSSRQLIDVVDRLKAAEMLDCLKLLHCHLGSQIPNIRDIRGGVLEACRYFVDLCKEGAAMAYIDLGGGLAVDYTGAQSNAGQSRNYSLREYCEDIVDTIKTTMDDHQLPHPVIITESGRATVAYSSILLFNILDVAQFEPVPPKVSSENDHELIDNMREVLTYLTPARVQECYNDIHYYRDEIRELFKRGQVDLRMRSEGENLFFEALHRIRDVTRSMVHVPVELEGLDEALADIYYGNFSLFQSLPDAWAIDQLFPVMPIHRLDETPDRRAVLADITCDCDGKIDQFINTSGIGGNGVAEKTLPLHSLRADEEYYLGVFLVGAYQETLGDLHNLFGDTHVVSVRINDDSSFDFVKEIQGDTIADVLSYVEFEPAQLRLKFRNKVEAAVQKGRISARERQQMIKTFQASLQGYTYYEKEPSVESSLATLTE
ncbi:Biosynthetic arginine decarboxylase [BD1-7 clade bacterium]|uniref:Arginine decarboxylase n=1 Tax=BD1-7 clade bacterium TaxID=2029982 RepID=A0A5S9PHD7_9GAMM|nr:Biosynthetic arginine decarboxylase [BD1-7 clade bacterium]